MERNTRQQQTIFDVLKSCHCHPTMKQLQELVAKNHPEIGQATIYRCVNRFVEKGLIQKFSEDGINYRYDVNYDHYHFKCRKCGKLEDIYITDKFMTLLKQEVQPRMINDYSLIVYGICTDCSN